MNKKIKVSVVLPFKDSAENLKNLLKHLSEQDELPNEIIIINASNKNIDGILIKFKKFFKITIKDYFNYNNKIKAYPGQNRNLGVKFASNDLIFFIDSKTLPQKDWIKNTKEDMIKNNFELILGTTKYYPSTFFQNVIHDLSYGNISYESVPGTAIFKKSFHKSGEFYNTIRAGEDIEWRKRAKSKLKYKINFDNSLSYNKIKNNIFDIIFVYFSYAYANSNIIIYKNLKNRINKLITLLLLILISFVLFNLSKSMINNYYLQIIIILFTIFYIFFRGFIYPIFYRKVNYKKLIFLRWIIIGLIGFVLDTSKYSGYFIGLLFNLTSQIINKKYNLT